MFKFLIAAILSLSSLTAQAFDPKNQVITVLIGFAPGGGTDNVVKPYLERMEELGYTTRIEYKAGAESMIAANYFSKLPGNGHTIMIAASSGLMLTEVFRKDMIQHQGFELVSLLGYGPNVLITTVGNNINTFEDFVKDIKTSEKKTFAAGSLLGDVAAQYLVSKLGAKKDDVVIANYRGMGPAVQDIAGGHVRYALVPMNVARPLVDGGKVRVLAVGGRTSSIPGVPTFNEKIKNFAVETTESNWGVVLPKDTPKEIVDFYSSLFTKIGKEEGTKSKLARGFIFITDRDLGKENYNEVFKRSIVAWQELKN
jgi:tripartite-type tricarboxylate transporter receptor subunit TctC